MNDLESRFHRHWLGLVQPSEGLVVSVPVLTEANCMEHRDADFHRRLRLQVERLDAEGAVRLRDLDALLTDILELDPERLERGTDLPRELALWVEEGQQLLTPTLAVRRATTSDDDDPVAADDPLGRDAETPAALAGRRYLMLIQDLPDGLALDAAETVTGPWHYPPYQKFVRLLRHCRVPIGLLTNRRVLRLVYAPHGASSGWIDFRLADMVTSGGRAIADAFVMLLGSYRLFSALPERQLPALLRKSRDRQADVTNALADQVFRALQILLDGFETAARRDGSSTLSEAVERGDDHAYGGLLTVLLRLVFLLYAEEHNLVPTDHPLYEQNLSVRGLFARLLDDRGRYPDTMHARFGAWPRLLAVFRAIFLGTHHVSAQGGRPLHMPPRRGTLFDPAAYPFLEGWSGLAGAPINSAEDRARVQTPSIDDGTVLAVLERLLVLDGQRLSYKALDVEQIGSVYERLMGYHVVRLRSRAVLVRADRARVWIEAEDLLAVPANQRRRWLTDEVGLKNADAKKLADAVSRATSVDAVQEALAPFAVKGTEVREAGRLVLQPGAERRRTSSHYTPRALTSPIVHRTLEPLLAAMGEHPSSAQILELKICDPAMGSGAFLVEACRFLADHLEAAWAREGVAEAVAARASEELNLYARRLVAQRCLYGVDKNGFAVELAKLSLWLVTMSRELPFTFVDHALRHGDSLVGLSLEQIREFAWSSQKGKTADLVRGEIKRAIEESVGFRQRILELAGEPGGAATREKELLLQDADEAIERARLVADLVVGAFFAESRPAARERERKRRLALVTSWLTHPHEPPDPELLELQRELRQRVPPLHWMLEFPEVFYADRPDPLDHDAVNRAAYMDAFVGNPPFAGKNGITTANGEGYLEWLRAIHEGAHGNADLSAHFFRRAAHLLGAHGSMGLIATNTIAQGDTRETGLKQLLAEGYEIYDARVDMPWPGEAAVTVSVVWLAHGSVVGESLRRSLDGRRVRFINSRLWSGAERADPVVLRANAGRSFQGAIVLGLGFTLTPEEREALVAANPANAERIFPYLGGQEVNSSPTQTFDRYVISFGQMSLEEAEHWPDLLAIVREKVKPERDQNKRDVRRIYWWRFGESAPALFSAIAPLGRCLVNSQVSKHLVFAFQPTDRIFSHTLNVFALDRGSHFAVLQSRIHEPWARLHGSTMKTDLRYTASSCFETFPFPPAGTLESGGAVDAAGERLYEARARYMVETQQGLTSTYNRLKDPACVEAPIEALRRLHEEMDRAVLEAYGWGDLEVPPYATPDTPEGRQARQAFEDEVIDRLFVLNAERAAQEQAWAAEGRCVRCGARRERAEVSFCDACATPAGEGGEEQDEEEA